MALSTSAAQQAPVTRCIASRKQLITVAAASQQGQSLVQSSSSVPRQARSSPLQLSTTCRVAALERVTTIEKPASYYAPPATQLPETFASKYELGDMLGKGTHAQVHVATCHTTGQQFAVKVLLKKKAHRDRTVQVLMEVSYGSCSLKLVHCGASSKLLGF